MKLEIIHGTRYEYLSAVRDSVNCVCLQPMPIPEQTVDLFILKVLPASRLTHSHDLFSNRVSRFEISEPHTLLLIEAQSRVSTHPPAPLPVAEKLCSFEEIQSGRISNVGLIFCKPAGLLRFRPKHGNWPWTPPADWMTPGWPRWR